MDIFGRLFFIWFLVWVTACRASPSAIVIPSSQYFEGNDGPWSTFNLRLGSPGQDARVLVSTAAPESLVVLSQYGCSKDVLDKVPSDCAVSRGNMFEPNESSTWNGLGTYGINGGGVGLEANLGYVQAAKFGLDTVGVGLVDGANGITLENQTIGGIATASPFYLGIFGINPQPLNFTTLGNFSSPSFITTLKNKNNIPSLSWSYTAGAMYRLKKVYGQLIFSGYDSSRFIENSVTFTMANDVTRDLVVALQAISYSGADEAQLLNSPIHIYIDSTDPNIWLPNDAVEAFESAFDLTLDDSTGLYLVNESHHDQLLASNAEVSFRLSDVLEGGSSVTITLPYRAFDLKAEYPLVDKTNYYFPLKRATNESQYTLGRVFLQEAYLTADYERGVFNVSQCAWVEGAKEHVVTITSKDADDDSLTDNISSGRGGEGAGTGGVKSDPEPESQPLSSGAIVGIVVGVVVGLAIAASAAYLLITRRNERNGSSQVGMPKEVTDTEGGDSTESGVYSILKTHQELAGIDNQIHQLHGEPMEEGVGGRVHVYELPGSEEQGVATYIEPVSSVSSPTMVESSVQ
ncbi:aspartic peptidase domain-containing protein [Fusarium flagelliforme]|uniref:aspartic peptidase domain-containing protein n=1 Tax=Fusarium flagelliforme TaxID=2675880 RepID=UPI001E8D570A|nr:aspartic peptidase domain-containing protein [Fusarium flagelliforme]KAH7174139.1 aspartic peptidase domain-containing protein [Fusarium flagelliforme]